MLLLIHVLGALATREQIILGPAAIVPAALGGLRALRNPAADLSLLWHRDWSFVRKLVGER